MRCLHGWTRVCDSVRPALTTSRPISISAPSSCKAWAYTASLLEANDNAGWDFLRLLLTAKQAAVKRSESDEVAILSAGGVRAHRFLSS